MEGVTHSLSYVYLSELRVQARATGSHEAHRGREEWPALGASTQERRRRERAGRARHGRRAARRRRSERGGQRGSPSGRTADRSRRAFDGPGGRGPRRAAHDDLDAVAAARRVGGCRRIGRHPARSRTVLRHRTVALAGVLAGLPRLCARRPRTDRATRRAGGAQRHAGQDSRGGFRPHRAVACRRWARSDWPAPEHRDASGSCGPRCSPSVPRSSPTHVAASGAPHPGTRNRRTPRCRAVSSLPRPVRKRSVPRVRERDPGSDDCCRAAGRVRRADADRRDSALPRRAYDCDAGRRGAAMAIGTTR